MPKAAVSKILILRGSPHDPYLLNKNPKDPYKGFDMKFLSNGFVQTLDQYLSDFVPDTTINIDTEDFIPEVYREKVKHRCIAVIEHGISLYKNHLDGRAEQLYIPTIEQGGIPDDSAFRMWSEKLMFEDDENLDWRLTKAIKKAIQFEEMKGNEDLFKATEDLSHETLNEFLKILSAPQKETLKSGIRKNLAQAQLRIEDLYEVAIKKGRIPTTKTYRQRIVELGLKDRYELKEKMFHFLRNALYLTNWNEDDALKVDKRAFASCLD